MTAVTNATRPVVAIPWRVTDRAHDLPAATLLARRVLKLMIVAPVATWTVDALAESTAATPGDVAGALDELAKLGRVEVDDRALRVSARAAATKAGLTARRAISPRFAAAGPSDSARALEAVTAQPMTVAELARRLGLARPRAQNILHGLEVRGAVTAAGRALVGGRQVKVWAATGAPYTPAPARRKTLELLPVTGPWQDAKAAAVDGVAADYFRRLHAQAQGNVSEMARVSGLHRAHVRAYLSRYGVGR